VKVLELIVVLFDVKGIELLSVKNLVIFSNIIEFLFIVRFKVRVIEQVYPSIL
jgi:hypothetical protein